MQDEAAHRYYEENAQSVFDLMLQVQPGEENFAPFLELIRHWQTPELPPARPGSILFHVLLKRSST